MRADFLWSSAPYANRWQQAKKTTNFKQKHVFIFTYREL